MKKFCCLLCGGLDAETVKIRTRDSDHTVVRCSDCGLEQLYPLPSIEEDAEYYNTNSHDKDITPSFSVEDIYMKFEFHNMTKIAYLEEYGINKDWKMLDFGCGYGFFIELMKKRGYEFDGIEISEERLRICKDRLGEYSKNIRKCNLLTEEIPLELKARYNLVTMFHLLEHISKPIEFLKKIYELIDEKGLLVVEVPNVDNLMMEASKEFNDFFYIRDHVAYYTPQLLRRVVEESGFRVIQQKGNQIYGLTNHMNWILNGCPELKKPSYESCKEMRWIEDIYKAKLNESLKSEYMYIIAEKT